MAKKSTKSRLDILREKDITSTRQFPASKKIYVIGSRPDVRVAMREIKQTSTKTKEECSIQ